MLDRARLSGRAVAARPRQFGRGARAAVEAVLLAKVVQGHGGDRHAPGLRDEVEDVVAGGVGMAEDELGDRAGLAGQKFAVRPASHAVMGRLNGLLGGDVLLPRGRGPADADQAGNLGYR